MTAVELRREGPVWPQSMPPGWRLLKFSWGVDIAEGQIDPEDTTYSDCVLIAPNHIESGTGRLIAKETAAEQGAISGKYRCRRGDVVYSKIRPALRKATIADEDCLCSADMYPLRPRELLVSRYLLYLIVSGPFTEWAVLESDRVAMPKINRESLNDLRIPVPPTHVQDGLVAFLDPRVSEVDSLVAAKQRLLDLLAEKRKAIIATAVTRGLDPKVKRRDSGVPWLGELPAHWELRRAKYLFRQSSLPVVAGDEIVTCFRDGQVTLRRNRREEGFTNADLEVGYQGIRQGQLVLHSMDAFAGAIGVSDSNGRCSPEYIICDPAVDGVVVPSYFGPLLRTMALGGFIQASCPAVRERAPRIRFNDFGEMYLPVPPMDEQQAIIEHIARETAKLDAVRAVTERTIVLLKERRATLIAAAVTGQFDVGGAA